MWKYVITVLLIVLSFSVVRAEPAGKTYILTQKFPAGTYKITKTEQGKNNAQRENNQKDGHSISLLSISTVTFSQPDDSGSQTIRHRLTRYKLTINDDDGRYKRVVDSNVDFQKKQTRLNNQVIFGLLFHNTSVFRYQPNGSVEYISGLDEEIEKNGAWNVTKEEIIDHVTAYVKANLANVRTSLPEKSVTVGDTWEKVTSSPLPPNTRGTISTKQLGTFAKIENISEREIALINCTLKSEADMTQDPAEGENGIFKRENEAHQTIHIDLNSGLLQEYISKQIGKDFIKDFTSYGCSGKTCSKPLFMKGTATYHSTREEKVVVEKLPDDKTLEGDSQ